MPLRRTPRYKYTQDELNGTSPKKEEKPVEQKGQESTADENTVKQSAEQKKEPDNGHVNMSRSKLRKQGNTGKAKDTDNQTQNTENDNKTSPVDNEAVKPGAENTEQNAAGENGNKQPCDQSGTESGSAAGSESGESVSEKEAGEKEGSEGTGVDNTAGSGEEGQPAPEGSSLPPVIKPQDTAAVDELTKRLEEKDSTIRDLELIVKEVREQYSDYDTIKTELSEKCGKITEMDRNLGVVLDKNTELTDKITESEKVISELREAIDKLSGIVEPADYSADNADLVNSVLQEKGSSVRFPKAMYNDLYEEYKSRADGGESGVNFTKVVIERIAKSKRFKEKTKQEQNG
jgi:hypothetical protein